MNAPPLSLYVHLPWCVRKCPYCDFNSHTAGENVPRQRYLDALLLDLERAANEVGDRTVDTVYLGGGTPSLFTPAEIARLLAGVGEHLALGESAEITMEANPGTVECGDPAGYRAAGVNRLSIGAQSFNDEHLERLGRIHSGADIRRAVDESRAAGFDNINLDLMHGLPGQDIGAALDDLQSAIELGPAHISWYQLTLEPNTVFYARPPANLPGEDTAAAIQDEGQALLASQGFVQYEVSAYARGDRKCRHNLNYWEFGDYLAIGAGAHGKITRTHGIFRYAGAANPLQYMKTVEMGGCPELRAVGGDEVVFEFMLNALRLVDGFPERLFSERTGRDPADLGPIMGPATDKGLVRRDDDERWRPTALGRRFLDDLQARFLPGAG